jgi:penicillin amidase
MKNLLRGALALILVVAAGISAAIWASLPPTHQSLTIPGLTAPVSVSFDQDGVPRIQGGNLLDATTALGYIHARDRMFQMDLMRRQASGRLAELVGPAALPIDRAARILGWEHRAEADYPALPAATRAMLEAYTRGVNAYIAQRGRFSAPEFLIFGAPQPWRPTDSLLWGKTMQSWLSYNARTELSRLALSKTLTPRELNELWPADTTSGTPQLALDARIIATAHRLLAALPAFPDPFTMPSTASNEWAVAGSRTKSGAPLLAGDPHLDLNFPAIWYLARIDTPDESLAGATAPGLPFLVIGHNRKLAWTFTTTGADTEDLFRETILPDGRYQTPDGPASFQTREEIIHVRGKPDFHLTVRTSRHGPIISDATSDGTVLALEAADLQPGDTAAAGIFALDQAQTIEDAQAAAVVITAPVQNMLVADRSHIALFTTGRVPVRKSGDGSFPVEGADGAFDWTGFKSGLDLPHYEDPASGQLVNGNERTAPADFPVYLGHDWYGDWRARRIKQLLANRDGLTPADFTAMQIDDVSLLARELLPRMIAAAPQDDTLSARAARLLVGWDGTMDQSLPQPLIYNAWIQTFHSTLLARHGAKDWSGPWAEFTQFVLSPAGRGWCGGDCDQLLRETLDTATKSLAARYGDDPAKWRWGSEHKAQFIHPVLGLIPVVKRVGGFSIAVNGDDQTIFRGGSSGGRLTSNHGPAYRGVYDLADLDQGSRFALAPGQSGNIFSSHAGDMMSAWALGKTISLDRTPFRTTATLSLVP